jgi:hypothetical protein
VGREVEPERIQRKEMTEFAVWRWWDLWSHGARSYLERAAHASALSSLAAYRPKKSVTIEGIKFRAVTSRKQIVVTLPRDGSGARR